MTSNFPAYWNSLTLHGVNPTGKEIGRGAYGRVFEVDYEGTLCAAKEVHALLLQYAQDDELQKIKDDFLTECQIWSTLRHPCVVQFLGNDFKTLITIYQVLLIYFDVIRGVLFRRGSTPITCYGNGEDAAKPERISGKIREHSIERKAVHIR